MHACVARSYIVVKKGGVLSSLFWAGVKHCRSEAVHG